MKKLLTLLLCAVFVFGTAVMWGCGGSDSDAVVNDTTFNGEYVKMEQEEISAFVNEMGNKDVVIDYNINCEADEKMTTISPYGFRTEIKMNYKQVFNEFGQITLAGYVNTTITGNGNKTTTRGDVYYYNEYLYQNLSTNGGVKYKTKQAYNLEEYMEQYKSESPLTNKSLKELFEYFDAEVAQGNGTVDVYFDNGETLKKCRIEIKGMVISDVPSLNLATTYDLSVDGTYWYVFDTEYNLIGYKCNEDNSDVSSGQHTSYYMAMKAYDGTISLPSDLDTYMLIEMTY